MNIYIIEETRSNGQLPDLRGYWLQEGDAIAAIDQSMDYWKEQFKNWQCFEVLGNYGRMIVDADSGLFVRTVLLEFTDINAPLDFSSVNPQSEIQSLKGTPDQASGSPKTRRKRST